MNIEDVRMLCEAHSFVITDHCLKRMLERNIDINQIRQVILNGEIIEQYPDDYPYPSCLILGNGLHAVVGIGSDMLWFITAYRPNPDEWDSTLKTRVVK